MQHYPHEDDTPSRFFVRSQNKKKKKKRIKVEIIK